jgi:hypothetical protein
MLSNRTCCAQSEIRAAASRNRLSRLGALKSAIENLKSKISLFP